jgi:hypothetical protein
MADRKTPKRSKAKTKTILRLPDLEQSKTAVLHSLSATSSQEFYGYAIDAFIGWYGSEPSLVFNRMVVLRYRLFVEQRTLAHTFRTRAVDSEGPIGYSLQEAAHAYRDNG